jgi:hypothetical protein
MGQRFDRHGATRTRLFPLVKPFGPRIKGSNLEQ